MSRIVTLLVSPDGALCDSIRPVIEKLGNSRFQVAHSLAAPYTDLYRSDLGLLIVHVGRRKSDAEDLMKLLAMVALVRRRLAVIVVADQPNPDLALILTRQQSAEYLERPLNLHRLGYLADTLTIPAREKAKQARPETKAVSALGETDPFLFAPDTEMGRLVEKILQVAAQDTTVLLTGETGSGKSRLTRLIHDTSARRDKPFHVVNCGALSANLVESELFGHLKGAFTGADRDRVGKCTDVGRGTLVLDEVDTLSLEMQAKLLRVVEDRVFEPVGSNKTQTLEARLVVATNRDLQDEIAKGRFRSDLYYRLNVVEFRLRPLRERPLVLRPLAEHFLSGFAAKFARPISGFTPEALQALQDYNWPGNVRELRNIIERAVALARGPMIELEDLPVHIAAPAPATAETATTAEMSGAQVLPMASALAARANGTETSTLAQTKDDAEVSRIAQALAKHGNNRQRAAAELGISRMTLYNKLHRYRMMGSA